MVRDRRENIGVIDRENVSTIDPHMLQRKRMLDGFIGEYERVMSLTGFGNAATTRTTLDWLRSAKLTNEGDDSIYWREDYIRKSGEQQIKEGIAVHRAFMSKLKAAEPYMSKGSMKRWLDRYYDSKAVNEHGYVPIAQRTMSKFEIKKAFILEHFSAYADRWISLGKKYDELMKSDSFIRIIDAHPTFAILKNRERFLDLNYKQRSVLLAEANASFLAQEKNQLILHGQASRKLQDAVDRQILSRQKVGIWLERIFKSTAQPKQIEEFVNGTGKNSLTALIENWADVKFRYNECVRKTHVNNEDEAARGLDILTSDEFLTMHYTQRLRYVEELESRMGNAKNVNDEKPIFIQIRHAMDMKDWTDAALLIAKAKKDGDLDDKESARLASMRKYVEQMMPKMKETESLNKVNDAKVRIDRTMRLMQKTHSPMVSLVSQLLRSLNANRGIHQLRWTVYNNLWCRTHGPPYLDDALARKGGSEDFEQLTKFRAEQGLDVGRHDALDFETADKNYFRKQEYSKTRATYMHANMESGGVMHALADFYEREQDPQLLYWRTLCPHMSGEPTSENWNRELLEMLTELRSCTKTLQDAGFRYDGLYHAPVSVN